MQFKSSNEKRIDSYLCEVLNLSRSRIQKAIEKGNILVNQKNVKKNYILCLNDEIFINDFIFYDEKKIDLKNIEIKKNYIDLKILYEDDSIAVIDKPRNLSTHIDEFNTTNTLVNVLDNYFLNLCTKNGNFRKGIVHRLDKETTGALIIVKTDNAYDFIKKQFQERSIYKEYIAIVRGGFSDIKQKGIINEMIGRSFKDFKKMQVNGKNAKEAITNYEVLDSKNGYSLVKCIIETGRTHQIRVHLKFINHSILGDKLYGIKNENENYLYLHARRLKFKNLENNLIDVIDDFDEIFINKLRSLNLDFY